MKAAGAFHRAFAAFLLAAVTIATEAAAADLRLVATREPDRLVSPAPEYPVPNDPGMVFFIQRSMNPNTVVYAARHDADGRLDRRRPLTAYWRRFNDEGEARKLSFIENQFAYGVRTSARRDGGWNVRFSALPDLGIVLERDETGAPVLTYRPDGQPIDLSFAWLQLDESGMLPSVTGVSLFGERRADGQPVQLDFSVSGGDIGG